MRAGIVPARPDESTTMPVSSLLTRALIGVAAGAALAAAVPLAASAHVSITPNQAAPGGWAYVTVRVPTESATASTTKLQVQLPTDTPFTSVSFQPTPGWTTAVTTAALPAPVTIDGNTITKAPRTITFTADGSGTPPGQFQTFAVSLGPVPDVGHVVLPATQTYSDGTVVQWRATPQQAAEDDTLEPAPVLWITDAPPAGHHAGPAATAAPGAHGADAGASGDQVALGLGIGALALGAAATLLAAAALGRARRVAP